MRVVVCGCWVPDVPLLVALKESLIRPLPRTLEEADWEARILEQYLAALDESTRVELLDTLVRACALIGADPLARFASTMIVWEVIGALQLQVDLLGGAATRDRAKLRHDRLPPLGWEEGEPDVAEVEVEDLVLSFEWTAALALNDCWERDGRAGAVPRPEEVALGRRVVSLWRVRQELDRAGETNIGQRELRTAEGAARGIRPVREGGPVTVREPEDR